MYIDVADVFYHKLLICAHRYTIIVVANAKNVYLSSYVQYNVLSMHTHLVKIIFIECIKKSKYSYLSTISHRVQSLKSVNYLSTLFVAICAVI